MKKIICIAFLISVVMLNTTGTNNKTHVPGDFNLATIRQTSEEIEGTFILSSCGIQVAIRDGQNCRCIYFNSIIRV